jgi:GNAT superfamily N-acetyltransferase
MTLRLRPYHQPQDLEAMKGLLRAGKLLSPFSGYAHPGEVDWWAFYSPSGNSPEETILLWETEGGDLAAWAWASLEEREVYLYLHPSHRGSAAAAEMLADAETHFGRKGLSLSFFASQDDAALAGCLEARGYESKETGVDFYQDLAGPVGAPFLPAGYVLLPRMQEASADQRADVHAHSFSPSRMTGDYYRRFMRAPDYDPDLDVTIVGPDGRFAAFAMVWCDATTKIGVFEPVGTRDEWQRRGLGRAALQEGMRRMRARDMTVATVSTAAHVPGNIAFYQACGFTIVNKTLRFTKVL